MSTTIDHRVVEMEFDNKQFERNVSTTMSSIDKLKQSLNFGGTSKSMSALSDAATNAGNGFSDLEATACKAGFHLEDVWHKISTVFEYQIARRIINAGKNMASALTIDPIKTGFQEYETQINAVQTILANTESKGKTLDDVNKALDELNTYADKTIYNFTEMTRNIGTFTAAGVDLDTSVSAIKGIANLAAVSGSTSQQASTAMYQLSQAMASGTVKLMDWNSVVNAGMGGQVFQDALKETAKVHGVAIDDIISKNGSFRESLSEGWLTTEILTDTLAKFTGDLSKEQLKAQGYTEKQIEDIMKLGQTANDAATKVKTFTQLFDTLKEAAQSGWTQTWEILVGDFEEAKELLTNISNVVGDFIGKTAEARNELLENWKVMGGRDDLIASFSNIWEGLLSIIKPISEAFREIFPPATAEQLFAFTEGLKEITAKMKIGDKAADRLKRTFKGVFAILDIFGMAIGAVLKAVGSLFGGVGELSGGLLGFTAGIGDALVAFRDFIEYSDIFNKVFKGVAGVIKFVVKIISTLVNFIADGFTTPALESFVVFLDDIVASMFTVGDSASNMKDSVTDAIKGMGEALAGSSLFKFFQSLWKGITVVASALANFAKILIGGFVDKLANANFEDAIGLLEGLFSGGILVGIGALIKKLYDSLSKGGELVDTITEIFDGIGGAIGAFESKFKSEALMNNAKAVLIMAAAVSLLVLSLVIITSIDSDKAIEGIASMTLLFGDLIGGLAIISKLGNAVNLVGTAASLLLLGAAMFILVGALKSLSKLTTDELMNGVIGLVSLTGVLALLGLASKLVDVKGMLTLGVSLGAIAVGLLILSAAIVPLTMLDWESLKKAAVILGGLMLAIAALGLISKLIDPLGMIALGASLVAVAAGLTMLLAPIMSLVLVPWPELQKAAIILAGLLGALTLLSLVTKLVDPLSMMAMGASLVIIAAGLTLLVPSLMLLGTMSWDNFGTMCAVLGATLAILAIGLTAMIAALPGALALLVVAGALMLFAPALMMLGAIPFEMILIGLGAMAGIFIILGTAGLLLSGLTPIILQLSAAIVVFGVGCLAAGLGMLAFAGAFAILATTGSAGVAAILALFTGIINLIPFFIAKLGEAIVALCDVVIKGAPAICNAIAAVIVALCGAVTQALPALTECIGALLEALLEIILKFVPKIVDVAIELIVALLDGLASQIGKVIASGVKVVLAFIKGVASQIGVIIKAAIDLMLDFINGLAEGIRTYTPKILDAVDNLMSAIFEAIGMAIGNIPKLGVDIATGLGKGIRDGISSAIKAAKELGEKVWATIKEFFKINSPSKKFAEIGMGLDEGMALGLNKYSNLVTDAAVGVGEKTMDSMGEAMSGLTNFVSSDIDVQPTIRPVLDLSDVKAGAGSIGKMFSGMQTIGVSANVGAISSMMDQRNQNGANDDVVSAIKLLRKDISGMKTETYNFGSVSYDGESGVADAVKVLARAARQERRG